MNRSRRSFCSVAAKGLFLAAIPRARIFGATPEITVDQLCDFHGRWAGAQGRAYRCDAVVTLLGVPVFSRRGVGNAVGRIREHSRGDQNIVSLWFAGGSDPSRTHGLRYGGSTEEIGIEEGSELITAASFGFVTVSPSDESFEQARKRVTADQLGKDSIVIVDEVHRPAAVRVRKAYVSAPESTGSRFRAVSLQARSRFAAADIAEREASSTPAGVPATFLYSVLAAIRSPEQKFHTHYLHNLKHYELDCEKAAESDSGHTRLTGHIHDLETRKTSTFRVWLEQGSDLPLRIEFSPRSYLRIVLEADPELKRTVESEEEI